MKPESIHLTEDQIIRAIVDEAELSQIETDHMHRCPECMEAVEELKQDLSVFGKMIRDLTPAPQKPLEIPDPVPGKWDFLSRFFNPAFALMMILIIGGGLWLKGIHRSPDSIDTSITAVMQEMEQDQKFMAEVDQLLQNPMPDYWKDILGETAENVNEEFNRFLFPENGTRDSAQNEALFRFV